MDSDDEDAAIKRVEVAMTALFSAHAAYLNGGPSAPLDAATKEVDAAMAALRALI